MNAHRLKSISFILAAASLALLPMGCKKQPPITLTCHATPPAVFAGDPVTVAASAGSVSTDKKNNVLYSWSGTGATGNASTSTFATASLDPGSYTATSNVKEGRKGKEGLKPGESAECSTSFTIKEFEPPTISCTAVPSTIKPGDTAKVTATGISPQNRPLTYSYAAASGAMNGSGTSATFNSTGAPTGTAEITCRVSDDKNHTATATTSISIVAPPPPPVPHVQALCSLSFSEDRSRPTRVSNEGKACLDQVALGLQQQSDAKAVLVGASDDKEKAKTARQAKFAATHKHAKVEDVAAQRAANARDYLVTEKGIDANRIAIATEAAAGQKVEDYLIPSGANFNNDVQGTTPANESTIRHEPRKPLAGRLHKQHTAK
ncbi:MAG TPA: hypothetical protein VK716_16865 [Terracidiphilus sp.]|nr:hypothetical protein [Terracidiphilus sp.]